MGLPTDLINIAQSGVGALVVTGLLGLLTWCSKRRDSLRRAERDLRIELREDIIELKRLNDELEKDIILMQNAICTCQKESHARQEEIFALKESIMKIKSDLWVQFSADRARDEKKS